MAEFAAERRRTVFGARSCYYQAPYYFINATEQLAVGPFEAGRYVSQ